MFKNKLTLLLLFFTCFFAFLSAKPDYEPVELNSTNFFEIVNGSKNVLVKFYAPWCGHCRQMAEDYRRLAANYAGRDDIVIAEINADQYQEFCDQFGIWGYPMLKFFPIGSRSSEDVNCSRRYHAMQQYVDSKIGLKK